ncbi:ficolin-1-like [Anopheles coustani]|uniref:ficolin-1-like n=1 Tax=Anopheles coustani TaxID=139045 RepID=UPI002658F11A|nr:ficolin-1-like [Anopheles coustani]
MPTVMEAIFHTMIDFRKEILDNFQLSLEYHTEQLEEIKVHMEYKMEAQENRMKNEINEIRKTLREISSVLVPSSCDRMKSKSSGMFYISPYGNIAQKLLVFCNFDNNFNLGGGWTVFQRRIDGSVDFFRNWTMYKHGFGDIRREHWLGLEKLHVMTRSGRHELLVLLEDFEGSSTYALYDDFKIASEVEKYKLTLGKYSGTAGDSLTRHNGMKFSTFDGDNDKSDGNLAEALSGAWWFGITGVFHLNGPYILKGNHNRYGVSWNSFRHPYSMKSATMMFRSRGSN